MPVPSIPKRIDRPGLVAAFGWTLVAVALCTGSALLLQRAITVGNIALLFLVPVMVAAASFGLRAGLLGAVLSTLSYNFFFIPPTGTLSISEPENAVNVIVLLGVALVTSQLAARVRREADLAQTGARANAALAGFARRLSAATTRNALLETVAREVAQGLGVRAVLMLPGPDGPTLAASVPADEWVEDVALLAAQWTLERDCAAGRATATLSASDWQFHPLSTARGVLAALGIARPDTGDPLDPADAPLLQALVDQAATALDRILLEEAMREARGIAERDRLRGALLSSVSHDLRTPLTAILSAVQALRVDPRPDLVDTVEVEAGRLNRFVANLLDMARLEAGALPLRIEATDLLDAVTGAVADMRRSLAGRPVRVDVAPDLPLVRADAQLLHHCLINLIDNADRHGRPGTPVIVAAARTGDGIALSVADEGSGIPPGEEARIFETFARIEGSDRSQAGTGLGLAIVRGFTEAMGLTVEARTLADPAGACFTIHVPDALFVSQEDMK